MKTTTTQQQQQQQQQFIASRPSKKTSLSLYKSPASEGLLIYSTNLQPGQEKRRKR